MGQLRRIWSIVLSKLVGFLIFLAVVLLINLVSYLIENEFLSAAVKILNSSIWIIVLLAMFFMLADIFWALDFPFNLPAPIFSAASSLFLISFIFLLLGFLGAGEMLQAVEFLIYIIVAAIILITGYIKVYRSYKRGKRARVHQESKKRVH